VGVEYDIEVPFFVKIQVGCEEVCKEVKIYSPYTTSPYTVSGASRTIPLYKEKNVVTIEEKNSQTFFIEIIKIWQHIDLSFKNNGMMYQNNIGDMEEWSDLTFKNNIFSYTLTQECRAERCCS
jgi:hypothetical protein